MTSVRVVDPRRERGAAATVRAFVALTKPRIIELLLVTTVPAMIVAAGGWPGTGLVLATLLGGVLSSGGANAINQVLDRDVDRLMARTRRRPLPTGRIEPLPALLFGIGLGVGGFLWLWLLVGPLAAALSTAALLFYVLVYTWLLKRRTAQNIVIGGAAGAVPALVGWAAVTGGLAPAAWIMFAVVFLWTPPHFWALSLRCERDYRAAGIPMLPVVAGVGVTLDRILLYGILVVGATFALVPVAAMGPLYLVTAALLGGYLLVGAVRLRRDPRRAMRFFGATNVYLAGIFLAMAADRLLR